VGPTVRLDAVDRSIEPFALPTQLSHVISLSDINRSEWPRGLRQEMSSPAQTLGLWVRIPLEAWMFVCVYFCVFSCDGLIPRPKSSADCV
jgi:hypothetical protein